MPLERSLPKGDAGLSIPGASIPGLIDFTPVREAVVQHEPYPYLIAHALLPPSALKPLAADYPSISQPGFFPLSNLDSHGAFQQLMTELQTATLAEILTEKLDIELRDKPCLITIRRWSAAQDGRIHNDSESKIVTALLYLNEDWSHSDAGSLRVLRSPKGFEESVAEILPNYGTFFAFRRTENSWHGHPPFVGERRVVQLTWLRNWDEYHRKQKRGTWSMRLKTLFLPFKRTQVM